MLLVLVRKSWNKWKAKRTTRGVSVLSKSPFPSGVRQDPEESERDEPPVLPESERDQMPVLPESSKAAYRRLAAAGLLRKPPPDAVWADL
jgi:hypothetical protein